MREREARAEEMQREAAKPFARTADDVDIDRAYRERVRFGDPMAHLAAKRQRDAPPPPVVPEHMRKLMRKSGFVVPQVIYPALRNLLYPPDCRPSKKFYKCLPKQSCSVSSRYS